MEKERKKALCSEFGIRYYDGGISDVEFAIMDKLSKMEEQMQNFSSELSTALGKFLG